VLYDSIGRSYANTRQPDPRIAALIRSAIGDATSMLNIGAGTGSYEPADVPTIAIEPSWAMISQRANAVPCIQAVAERLPIPDRAFDCALASLTVHHWTDFAAGLAEMRRVSARQVFFTWDADFYSGSFWLDRDYRPDSAVHSPTLVSMKDIVAAYEGAVDVVKVPVPSDCIDGFAAAYWNRPEAYLDARVQAGISWFALADQSAVAASIARLAADLDSGAWDQQYGYLRDLEAYDFGYRLVVAGRLG
jgi:SAM-dependent methyltransferase